MLSVEVHHVIVHVLKDLINYHATHCVVFLYFYNVLQAWLLSIYFCKVIKHKYANSGIFVKDNHQYNLTSYKKQKY